MVARPKPPLAAHSSFATRSSFVGRMARQREVTFRPLLLMSVYTGRSRETDNGRVISKHGRNIGYHDVKRGER